MLGRNALQEVNKLGDYMSFVRRPDTARVTVCNACLRMGCAAGDLKCSHAERAGITMMSVGELHSRGNTETVVYWTKKLHA